MTIPNFDLLLGDIDPVIRRRGLQYYREGRVHNPQIVTSMFGVHLSASVKGTKNYHVELDFDEDGELINYSCRCQAFALYDGMCKHCAALLYAAKEKFAASPPEVPAVRTDPFAKYFLQSLKSGTELEGVEPGSVSLEPTVGFSHNFITLTLKIGIERMYVLRDIDGFVKNIKSGAFYSYGKQLAFTHLPEAFDERSRALIKLILRHIDIRAAGQYYVERTTNFVLSDGEFDELFDILRGGNLKISPGRTVRVLNEEPAAQLRVEKLDGGITVSRVGNDELISTDEYNYMLGADYIARCKALPKSVGQLLYLLERQENLTFDDGSAEELITAIPQLSENLDGDESRHVLASLIPEQFNVELLLDAPDNDRIVCSPYCIYGEDRYIAGRADGENRHRRDRNSETRLRQSLEALFDSESDGLFSANGNDSIYRLLTENIPRLSELGKVKISDRLKRLTVTAPRRASAGVSLSGGILHLELDTGGLPRERLYEILAAYREKRRYYRLPEGGFVSLDESLEALDELCGRLDLDAKQLSEEDISLPAYRTAYLDGLLREGRALDLRADEAFDRFAAKLRSACEGNYPLPESLDGILRPYQESGYSWLRRLEECELGGILADEMGLGKTLEMTALLLARYERGESLPSLIVCPASLVYNWKRELERFAPSLKLKLITGTAAQRRRMIAEPFDSGLIVTSYDLLKKDIDSYSGIKFACCVIDEAQYIKNHSTLAAKAVRRIDSKQRFALTGTPVENRLSELWSIFDFLMPGYLYSYARFRQRFEQPIADGDEAAREGLRRMIAPFVLRRLKSDVLTELPPKTVSVLPVELGDKQLELYRAALASGLDELHGDSSQGQRMKILALLTRLRQICCDPSLCYENYNGGSAKLDVCVELISQAKESEHRVLVFSQFTSMLERLEGELDKRGIFYEVIRGSTRKDRRLNIAERFNGGEWDVLLVSLKAGGTGLNLTGADMVIHFDPWWNLAAESQATDRAHRIGQNRPVQVYKLIAAGTVEEKVLELQERKRELAALVENGDAASGLSADELLSILSER